MKSFIFRVAADIIRKGHCKGTYALCGQISVDPPRFIKADRYCLMGALWYVCELNNESVNKYSQYLLNILNYGFSNSTYVSLADYNDRTTTTQDDVIDLLLVGASRLENEQR